MPHRRRQLGARARAHETLGALGAGSHTFDIRATDAAGNTDPTPASYTWTIDLTAPNTTIDTNASPTRPATPPQPSPSAPPKPARPSNAVSTAAAGPLLEPTHSRRTRAPAATPSTSAQPTPPATPTPTPASHTWTIDVTSPTVTITDPTAYLNGSDPEQLLGCCLDAGFRRRAGGLLRVLGRECRLRDRHLDSVRDRQQRTVRGDLVDAGVRRPEGHPCRRRRRRGQHGPARPHDHDRPHCSLQRVGDLPERLRRRFVRDHDEQRARLRRQRSQRLARAPDRQPCE